MIRALGLATLVLFSAGCRCKSPGPVNPVDLGLRVEPASLEFGRVLEGDRRTLELKLTSITRAPISVTLETSAPFSVEPEAEVPGGGDALMHVTFLAGNGPADGGIELRVADQLAVVPVSGIGVRAPACIPSAQCIVSTYSLEEDRCIETQAPDETPCETASVCLEQGRCRAGQCLGIARSCDDGNPCTDDACAMDVGCVYVAHQCPAPTEACRVAACDAQTGCGSAPAPDFTLCGSADCVEVHYCSAGECKTEPTPEGFTCAPPIACLPEGTCRNQVCERPVEGDWVPEWSARLSAEPVGELVASGATVFLSACVTPADAGAVDAGDAGEAGNADAGDADAGAPDAAVPFVCGLTSYTGTGFERLTVPYLDGQPRWLVGATPEGLVVQRDGGLELRSLQTHALVRERDFAGTRAQLVLSGDEVWLLADGRLERWSDAGTQQVASVGDAGALALGTAFFAWDPTSRALTRIEVLDDGGIDTSRTTGFTDDSSLAVLEDRAVLGGAGVMSMDGSVTNFVLTVDGGPLPTGARVLGARTLVDTIAANVFYEVCDAGCAERVQAVSIDTGLSLWDAEVFPGGLNARTVLAAQVQFQPGSMAALVRAEVDGGAAAWFELISQGQRRGLCRIGEANARIEQAVLTRGALVVTARRADGGVQLDSYPLLGLPVSRLGWPQVHGVDGHRANQ